LITPFYKVTKITHYNVLFTRAQIQGNKGIGNSLNICLKAGYLSMRMARSASGKNCHALQINIHTYLLTYLQDAII